MNKYNTEITEHRTTGKKEYAAPTLLQYGTGNLIELLAAMDKLRHLQNDFIGPLYIEEILVAEREGKYFLCPQLSFAEGLEWEHHMADLYFVIDHVLDEISMLGRYP